MRGGVILVGFVSFVASAFVVAWLVRDKPTETLAPADGHITISDDHDADGHDHGADKPKIAERPKVNPDKNAPQPKAVIDETTFAFGGMELGEEREHVFVIRNEGTAPLAVVAGPTTCQCTVGKVSDDLVEPGKSAEVKLTWKPTMETEEFNKGAEIWTNDPGNETIKLSITGIVAAKLRVLPGYTWSLAEFREDGLTELKGMVVSPIVENFAITGFDCENKHATAEATKIDDAELLKTLSAISGYHVTVTLQKEMSVGGFNFPLKIATDLVSQTGSPVEIGVTIRGSRRGPIRIVGKEWVPELGVIALGSFDVGTGKSVTLKAVALQPPPEGLKVNDDDIICDPKELKVRIVPDEKAKQGAGRFLLTVEYPPGAPRATRREEQPARVKIRTNHPGASELEFMVYFSAF